MFLPEFLNPFAFVSSHAWLMNSLHSKHNPNQSQGIQLLHLALLTPSQARFHLVLKAVMRGYKQNTNLHFAFMQFCSKNKLPTHGGIGPESDCELEDNLKKLESAIKALNHGKFLDKNGILVNNNFVVIVQGVGTARAQWFPSLCCFTGFGTTQLAIQTAKQAMFNSNKTKSGAGSQKGQNSKLECLLRVENDFPHCKNSHYNSILEQTGLSVGDVQSTMGNASYASTQTGTRHVMFVKEQTMHTLFLDADAFIR